MDALPFEWPSGETAPCHCPHCGHVDAVQVSAAREWDLVNRDGECSACGGEYTIAPTKAGTLAPQKLPRDTQSHLIKHHYDIGDQGVTVTAPLEPDVRRAAVYIQLCAEKRYGDTAMVMNLGIAAALVTFYGCKQSPRNFRGAIIDMHHDREKLIQCREASTLMSDLSLHRDGLQEFLRPYVVIG